MGWWGRCATFAIGVLVVNALPSAAQAEAVSVNGWYAAPARDVAVLRSIAVGRISGEDGDALSLLIERALGDARDRDGGPYFDLLATSRRDGGPQAEGIVSGVVTTGVDKSRYKKTVKQCPDGPKAKCKDEEEIKVEIDCNRRVVTVDADLRVVRTDDNRIIYSNHDPQRQESSWCPRDSAPPETEAVIRKLVEAIADNFAAASVPRWRRQNIRFREDRKGLSRDDADRFKLALRQTKTDVANACATWAAIEATTPGHPSVLFDLALCAEAAGELDRAVALYRSVASRSTGKPSDINDALGRIASRLAAIEDERERARASTRR